MAMKWSAAFLAAVALLGCVCDAQYPGNLKRRDPQAEWKPREPPQTGGKPREPPKTGGKAKDPIQAKETFGETLNWRFPVDPVHPTKPTGFINVEPPSPASSVAAECRENLVHVEVKKDMFGIGQLIQPADITMGGCAVLAEDAQVQVLIFESELHACNCRQLLSDDGEWLIYVFTLNYVPSALAGAIGPIVRTGSAEVTVECHYPRKHDVSIGPLIPLWIPFSATKVAEELLYFSLKLMTADWMHVRPVNIYYLGELIHMEASVFEHFHVPLRVYVDYCIATVIPENPTCRYEFIQNYGCLVDAKLTGSTSTFLPRTSSNKLQFQLEAFMFQKPDSGMAMAGGKAVGDDSMRMQITCNLKASTDEHPIIGTHKACSFANGRWTEALGVRDVCNCCDSDCASGRDPGKGGNDQMRTTRDLKTSEWSAAVSVTFDIKEREDVGV